MMSCRKRDFAALSVGSMLDLAGGLAVALMVGLAGLLPSSSAYGFARPSDLLIVSVGPRDQRMILWDSEVSLAADPDASFPTFENFHAVTPGFWDLRMLLLARAGRCAERAQTAATSARAAADERKFSRETLKLAQADGLRAELWSAPQFMTEQLPEAREWVLTQLQEQAISLIRSGVEITSVTVIKYLAVQFPYSGGCDVRGAHVVFRFQTNRGQFERRVRLPSIPEIPL